MRSTGVGESLCGSTYPVEEVLAGIWAEILGLELLALTTTSSSWGALLLLRSFLAHANFQVELPLSYLFESPTIAR